MSRSATPLRLIVGLVDCGTKGRWPPSAISNAHGARADAMWSFRQNVSDSPTTAELQSIEGQRNRLYNHEFRDLDGGRPEASGETLRHWEFRRSFHVDMRCRFRGIRKTNAVQISEHGCFKVCYVWEVDFLVRVGRWNDTPTWWRNTKALGNKKRWLFPCWEKECVFRINTASQVPKNPKSFG